MYVGRVSHARRRPAHHAFRHRVCAWLIDLGELDELARRLPLFSVNAPNVFSFYERDYGPRDGSPLRPWIDRQLLAAGIDLQGGPVRILCFPRLFGYGFNPLSVWFCHRIEGSLAAVLLEVSNVAAEWHCYLVRAPEPSGPGSTIRAGFAKRFHVSGFIGMSARYDCRIAPPGRRLALQIQESEEEAPTFSATWVGMRRELTTSNVLRVLGRHPLMTFKISAAIYWHALRLTLKGVPRHARPTGRTRGGVTDVSALTVREGANREGR